MDDDEFEDEFPDIDELRFNYGNAIVRLVKMAQEKAALPNAQADFILAKVANSVAIMHTAWERTAYYRKAVPYPCIDVPMPEEILKPIVHHSAGEKHPQADLSLSMMVMETGAAGGPRSSSPASPKDVDVVIVDVDGGDKFRHPEVPIRRRQPATPSGGESGVPTPPIAPQMEAGQRAAAPLPSNAAHSVAAWVANMAAVGTVVQNGEAGEVARNVVAEPPMSAQRLIEVQQAWLEQMRQQVEASEAKLRRQFDAAVVEAAKRMAEEAAAQQ